MADLAKARKLLDRLSGGKDVTLRELENALGKDGLADYESRWQEELDRRTLFAEKPDEIKEYEALVHAGDFDENRADGIKTIGKRSKRDLAGNDSRVRLRNLSESKYERAIEYLKEIITIDSGLRIWFDRDLDFGADTTTLSIDRVGIARTVTSRSSYKRSEGMAKKRSKAEVKMDVLNAAIAQAEGAGYAGEQTEEQLEIIKRKLAALMGKKR